MNSFSFWGIPLRVHPPIELRYLFCIHVDVRLDLSCDVHVHHGGSDSDGGFAIRRGRRHPILVFPDTSAARCAGQSVSAARMEAVLTGAWFPHVLGKLSTRRHINTDLALASAGLYCRPGQAENRRRSSVIVCRTAACKPENTQDTSDMTLSYAGVCVWYEKPHAFGELVNGY